MKEPMKPEETQSGRWERWDWENNTLKCKCGVTHTVDIKIGNSYKHGTIPLVKMTLKK